MNNLHEITSRFRAQARPHLGQTAARPTGFYDLDARNGLPQKPKEAIFHDIRQPGHARAGPR
jgi:hypothetical protein